MFHQEVRLSALITNRSLLNLRADVNIDITGNIISIQVERTIECTIISIATVAVNPPNPSYIKKKQTRRRQH